MIVIIIVFPAIGVAADTVGNVANPFLTVFTNHFLLIVAVGASVRARIVARMADGAVAVGPFMVDGEGVVERSPGKGAGIVAGRALTGVMIGGRGMAGSAVLAAND